MPPLPSSRAPGRLPRRCVAALPPFTLKPSTLVVIASRPLVLEVVERLVLPAHVADSAACFFDAPPRVDNDNDGSRWAATVRGCCVTDATKEVSLERLRPTGQRVARVSDVPRLPTNTSPLLQSPAVALLDCLAADF